MQLKIKTPDLKDMVTKAIKGAGNNKLLPLTSLMCIKVEDNKLSIITSDGTNYLYVTKNIENEYFYVTIQAEQFSKLISKLTCGFVELVVTDRALEVKGNGTYKIEIPMDEEGSIIQYPDPLKEVDMSANPQQVKLTSIKNLINGCKSSLATTLEIPCYTGYYCGEKVIATDTNKIASLSTRLFNTDILLAPEFIDLLDIMTAENIDVCISDKLVFATPDVTVIGRCMDGIEEYAVEPITELIESGMTNRCKVGKVALMSLIERIALFVGPYDDKTVRLTFTEEGVNVESMQATGVESIVYVDQGDFAPYTCLIDIEYLMAELKALSADTVEIYYGSENAIKFVEGNMTIIIALKEENNAGEE